MSFKYNELLGVRVTLPTGLDLTSLGVHSTDFISTLNAELLLMAREDERFKYILNLSETTLDGYWTCRAFKNKYPNVNDVKKDSGSEIIYDVITYAAQKKLKVMLLGGQKEINNLAVAQLKRISDYSGIVGYSPKFESYPFSSANVNEIKQEIENHKPDYIITAFGAPKQEFWAYETRDFLFLNGVSCVFFFGGAIDMVAGKYTRAPRVFQKIGLESLWRLFQDRNRWKREMKKFKFLALMFMGRV